MTKAEIAKIAGVGPSSVTKWAAGGLIRASHLHKIALHFGVPVYALTVNPSEPTTPVPPIMSVRSPPVPAYGVPQPSQLCRFPADCDLVQELAGIRSEMAALKAQMTGLHSMIGVVIATRDKKGG